MNEKLRNGITYGKFDDIISALGDGAQVNNQDNDGNTPLHLIIKSSMGTKDMAEMLITQGADIDIINKVYE